MVKGVYHPNAFLSNLKNVKRGLKARTQILLVLERGPTDTKTVMGHTQLHYGVVMHHLKLLQAERIVESKMDKPRIWVITGVGQKRLANAI